MTRRFLLVLMLGASVGVRAVAQKVPKKMGYWTFGTEKNWLPGQSGGPFDLALAAFVRLKQTYGDQFNVVVEDLKREGTPQGDGTKTAQIQVKVYVNPPNEKIERELKAMGLTYID